MVLFDCNCYFGECSHPVFRYARNPGELLEEMDFCGIDRALVYHSSVRFGSPITGNAQLIEEIKGQPRLAGTWTILPCQTGEMPAAKELLSLMKANGIRALRAFPNEHRYQLDGGTFGELFELLIEKEIPLFVKDNAVSLGRLLSEFPELTVVAVHQGPHSLERYLRPLVEAFPDFYIETSAYIVDGLIEEFCSCYGSTRLVFGSGFPDNCSGAALLRLLHADIKQSDKESIAHGNIERLLEKVKL